MGDRLPLFGLSYCFAVDKGSVWFYFLSASAARSSALHKPGAFS
jgi:hypothetical protein